MHNFAPHLMYLNDDLVLRHLVGNWHIYYTLTVWSLKLICQREHIFFFFCLKSTQNLASKKNVQNGPFWKIGSGVILNLQNTL